MAASHPLFCATCGAKLPPNAPHFCVECGAAVRVGGERKPDVPDIRATTGPTVRLGNARVEQAVIGGTIKLPTAGAIPPGMWLQNEPPSAEQTIALYAPLRAIVGGWSATTSDGWRKAAQVAAGDNRNLVRFESVREWFPATGCGHDLRLRVRIGASSYADEGRTRRGFTYHVGNDPPMEVLTTEWFARDGRLRDLPVPQIQLMAPPRIKRISDFSEPIRQLSAREADAWAKQGVVHGLFRLPDTAQQRTPVGRGLALHELFGGAALLGITGRMFPPFRVQLCRPLIVRVGDWPKIARQMTTDAAKLGLDIGTDAATEWWLDQRGHDGAVFERGAHDFAPIRTAVVFRRNQIAAIC